MLPAKLAPEEEVPVESLEEARKFLENDFKVGYFHTSVEEIDIHKDGTVTAANRCWQYTPSFLESLAKTIKMPLKRFLRNRNRTRRGRVGWRSARTASEMIARLHKDRSLVDSPQKGVPIKGDTYADRVPEPACGVAESLALAS